MNRRSEEQRKKDLAEGVKVCNTCDKRLPLGSFRVRRNSPDGRTYKCRECERVERDPSVRLNTRSVSELEADLRLGSKVCTKCGERFSFSKFHKRARSADGYAFHCKPCQEAYRKSKWVSRDNTTVSRDKDAQRRRNLLRSYNMTPEEYDAMCKGQGGVCAICSKAPSIRGKLFVDHDHGTGEIRGLLCSRCNTMLGHSTDSSSVLRAGADYLDRTSSYNKEVTKTWV